MRFVDQASNRYALSAELATAEGFTRGSHPWWEAMRFHRQFTFLPTQSVDEHETILAKHLKEMED